MESSHWTTTPILVNGIWPPQVNGVSLDMHPHWFWSTEFYQINTSPVLVVPLRDRQPHLLWSVECYLLHEHTQFGQWSLTINNHINLGQWNLTRQNTPVLKQSHLSWLCRCVIDNHTYYGQWSVIYYTPNLASGESHYKQPHQSWSMESNQTKHTCLGCAIRLTFFFKLPVFSSESSLDNHAYVGQWNHTTLTHLFWSVEFYWTLNAPVFVSGVWKSVLTTLLSEVLRMFVISTGRRSRFFSRKPVASYSTCRRHATMMTRNMWHHIPLEENTLQGPIHIDIPPKKTLHDNNNKIIREKTLFLHIQF